MNGGTFNRLHTLRMENDEAGYRMQEMAPRFAQLANRHENGTAPRAVSAFNLFQTPVTVAADMAARLELRPGARVGEFSAGLGRLLDATAPYKPGEVVAVEISPILAGELYRQNRAGVRIMQRDFLACTVADLGTFDAVVMNPPFHMRADIRHIQHALTFLNPGGILCALCLDTSAREKALKGRAATWTQLPAGTFGREGTSVPTVMLTIKP